VIRRDALRVPVNGGYLHVTRWPARHEDSPVVLAVHGITANSRSWDVVARELNGAVTLVAPDLRGRGGSGSLPGPYGIGAHVTDLVMVLSHLCIARAVVLGHSMGAFVACALAERHPERAAAAVLVDGGVSFPVPKDLDPDAALHAIVGPALDRLNQTFPSRQAYRSFWQEHPAFRACWSPDIDSYVQYDLVGQPPLLRSSCSPEAVRTDGRELLVNPAIASAVHQLRCPAVLLWAERGLQDQPHGLYDEQRLAAAGLDPRRVQARRLDDVNHYTALLTVNGAAPVADTVIELAEHTNAGQWAVQPPSRGIDAPVRNDAAGEQR
jgi:pimeloyl-ACP methyl ester carboxylesterase